MDRIRNLWASYGQSKTSSMFRNTLYGLYNIEGSAFDVVVCIILYGLGKRNKEIPDVLRAFTYPRQFRDRTGLPLAKCTSTL